MTSGGAQDTIGLVSVGFDLFDGVMPSDFKSNLVQWSDRLASLIQNRYELVYPGPIGSEQDALRANSLFKDADVCLVIFAPTMAAPPSYGLTAVSGLNVPVIIWDATEITKLPLDLNQIQAHSDTRFLGCLMFANVLLRDGVTPMIVNGSLADARAIERVTRIINGTLAGRSLRGAVALRVGEPVPGYSNIVYTTDQLAALGITEEKVAESEMARAFNSVSESEVEELMLELSKRRWEGVCDVRSARLAIALRHLPYVDRATLGTVNCHGPLFRQSETVGIAACLAMSLATTAGLPFSCTGDLPAAIALLLMRRLAGRALYGELYTYERETGEFLFANGGEGDGALAQGSIRIHPTTHFPGRLGRGAAISFDLPPGPATLISLSADAHGWRIVWSIAEVTTRQFSGLAAPNAMLRFDDGAPDKVAAAWIGSGATHHVVLTPGCWDVEIPAVAAAIGAASVRI